MAQINEQQLWTEIQSLKSSVSDTVDINTLIAHLHDKYLMPDSEEIRKVLKYQLKRLKLLSKRKNVPLSSDVIVLSFEPIIVVEEANKSDRAKRRKSFNDLSSDWKRARTDEILDRINLFVEEENSSCTDPEKLLTPTKLLGYLLYRINYCSNKSTADIGKSINEGKCADNKKSFLAKRPFL